MSVPQRQLFYLFNLEERIPADHLLRRINPILTGVLADLREKLASFYSDIGRPSIDPELMMRMLMVGYCYGIRSERRLTALRIGKHLVRSGDLWALDIPADDVKKKRPLEYPISADLSRRIEVYLNQFRCRIRGAFAHDYLWASNQGRPMIDAAIYARVKRHTREALGFAVNPHRFRRAAATFWSIRDPANVRGAKDLLGHASFGTTQTHYIMTQSRLAGRALAHAIDGKRKEALPHRTVPRP